MAGFNAVRSALRLSAITVAAGTIFGLATAASAQSRVERAERALERAQQELDQARREAGRSDNKKTEVQCELNCQGGCPGDEQANDGDDDQIETTVQMDDDGEGRVIVRQPGERRIERKIVIRGDDDGRCPVCGGPMNSLRKVQPRDIQGMFDGGPHMKVFRMDGPQGGRAEVHTFGKAIVIGPDGQRREFNFGGGEDGERQEGQNTIRRFRVQKDDGDGPGGMKWKVDGPKGMGKIIIVGPDGQSREIDLGGIMGGQSFHEGGDEGGEPFRIRIEKFRDGQGSDAHPAQGRGERGGERRVYEVRTLSNTL